MSSPKNQLLWTIIGVILTIAGTFIPASTINVPWTWNEQGVSLSSLQVPWQIGAVLLTACVGGKWAGALSQIIYLALGLWPYDWPVFSQGGGLDYLLEPSFGYLMGFVPGAWYCGRLAFVQPRQLESIALSGLAGLGIIHGVGLIYLVGLYLGSQIVNYKLLVALIMTHSWEPLPAQLVLVCAVTVLAYGLRSILFY